jgi:hypothetical protein
MNKFLFFFLFFVFSTITFFSQTKVNYLATFDDKKIHYGIYLGLNQTDYRFNVQNITGLSNDENAKINQSFLNASGSRGFNVGLIADLRLHKNLNLRLEPGLVTNAKTLTINPTVLIKEFNVPTDYKPEINNTFLHVPLVLKFSADRLRNIRPYILGGVSLDYNFSANKSESDNSASQFRTKPTNFMYEVGVGIDIYLYFFKFSPSIRGVFAINNEIVYDNASTPSPRLTDPITSMQTRGIFLNFAFE